MKAKTAKTLSSLVALKRQQAEQAYGSARADLAAAEAELAAMQAQLRAVPEHGDDFEAAALSDRFGHSRRLLALIEAQRGRIAEKQLVVARRQHELRRAFGSERALSEIISDEV